MLKPNIARGESAFHSMLQGLGWAKHPMVTRIDKLHKEVPITLMYGSDSWVDKLAAETVKEKRMNSFVQAHIIPDAGHHIYADMPETFNQHVNEACAVADASVHQILVTEETNLGKNDANAAIGAPNGSATTSPNA